MGLYLSLSDEKHSQCAEGQRGCSLGVERLYFHCLAEHCHGEDQAQDLNTHTQTHQPLMPADAHVK